MSKRDSDNAEEYFREVLRTFRLIFGQNSRSSRTFNSVKSTWNLSLRQNSDPMLEEICGQSCESDKGRRLWDEIAGGVPSIDYRLTDFAFLGERLLYLQSYVKIRKPHNINSLWVDIRDSTSWWHLWVGDLQLQMCSC